MAIATVCLDYLKSPLIPGCFQRITRWTGSSTNTSTAWASRNILSHAALDYTADGKTHFKAELTRAGVPDSWKDAIPLYAHIGDKTVKMGNITATHANETVETAIQGKIDRISINDCEEILGDVKQ